jgi:hypothetical protein
MIRMRAFRAAARRYPAWPRDAAISSLQRQPRPRIRAQWRRNRISGQLELTWHLSSRGLSDGEIAESPRVGLFFVNGAMVGISSALRTPVDARAPALEHA